MNPEKHGNNEAMTILNREALNRLSIEEIYEVFDFDPTVEITDDDIVGYL